MARDTKRDRVWRAVLELGADPPAYRVIRQHGSESGTVRGFGKPDVRETVEGAVGDRTVHDVIMTMLDYGILEMVKEPAHAPVAEHPVTGDQVRMDVYALAHDWRAGEPADGAGQSDEATDGVEDLDRRCPWCGQTALVRDGANELCTEEGCNYVFRGKFRDAASGGGGA